MIGIYPGQIIRLAIVYQENGTPVTGLTDLTVTGINQSGVTKLAETVLTEGTNGEYYYSWNTAGNNFDDVVRIYYKKGSAMIDVDEYYFGDEEDAQML